MKRILLASACSVLLMTGPSAAAMRERGWWVVLGSFANNDGAAFQGESIVRVRRQAAGCGLEPFNDVSAKFEGFAKGYDVSVIGAYASRAEADRVLRQVSACVSGAYVKFGRYLGE